MIHKILSIGSQLYKHVMWAAVYRKGILSENG
jgi:hypothetical protein